MTGGILMRQTENYKWDLQEGTDEIDIEGLNEIFEAADAELAGKADAQTTNGGFKAGQGATVDSDGAAMGKFAYANRGFGGGFAAAAGMGAAAGLNAKTSDGIAAGMNAKTEDEDGNAIDAVQLGTGTNPNEKTFQVYTFQMMDEDGQIPRDRITAALSAYGLSRSGTVLFVNAGTISYSGTIELTPSGGNPGDMPIQLGYASIKGMQENASRAAWSGTPNYNGTLKPGIYNIRSSVQWDTGMTLPGELSHLYEGWANNEEELTLIYDGRNYFLIYTKADTENTEVVTLKVFWARNAGEVIYGWSMVYETQTYSVNVGGSQ